VLSSVAVTEVAVVVVIVPVLKATEAVVKATLTVLLTSCKNLLAFLRKCPVVVVGRAGQINDYSYVIIENCND